MTARRSLRGAALPASLAVLFLAACGGPASGAPEPAEPSAGAPLVPADPAADLPDPDLDLGTVAAGTTVEARLSGRASVGFAAPDDLAVVADLDCSACTGPVEVTSPDRGSAWGSGAAPLSARYLVDLSGPQVPDRVEVHAAGEWTLTLRSTDDLPASTGEQTGTGPVVLRLADEGEHVRVAVTPAGPGDDLSARLLATEATAPDGTPQSMAFGSDGAIDQSYAIPMPGVVALDTDGAWTVQVLP